MSTVKPPAKSVIRLSLSIDPDVHDRLRDLAGAAGISVSEAIRRAVDAWIASQP